VTVYAFKRSKKGSNVIKAEPPTVVRVEDHIVSVPTSDSELLQTALIRLIRRGRARNITVTHKVENNRTYIAITDLDGTPDPVVAAEIGLQLKTTEQTLLIATGNS
jgi:hypothetical protein